MTRRQPPSLSPPSSPLSSASALLGISGVAAPPEADARARSPGRPRGHAAGRAPEGTEADEGGSRPFGLDHAQPRRPLGVSEPEIRTQGSDQITIQLPGVKDPEAAAKIIGKTAQLELFDLEADLVPPSIDINTQPDREDLGLRPPRRPAGARCKGTSGAVLRLRHEEEAHGGAGADEGDRALEQGVRVRAASCPTGTSSSRSRRRPSSSRAASRTVVCPGVGSDPTSNDVLPVQVRPARRPGDDRLRPEALRHAAGLRHAARASRSCCCSSRSRAAKRFEEITRAEAQRGKLLSNTIGGGQTDIVQHFAIVLDREIKSWPPIDWHAVPGRHLRLERRPDHGHRRRSRRRRTSRSSSRPVRCRSSSSRSTRPRSRRRSARTR